MFRRDAIEDYVEVDETAHQLLRSPEAPIMLLPRRMPKAHPPLAEAVAPDNAWIGAFLPYTPLHELLLERFPALVATSANFSDEPLLSREAELGPMLAHVADFALTHDREIEHKCDDSVVRPFGAGSILIRRARGWVPRPVPLARVDPDAEGTLAVGGELKSTFALLRDGAAVLSQHLGDLEDLSSRENWDKELADFCALHQFTPERAVCDLHPDYYATRRAEAMGLPLLHVQHHYAHLASVLADNGETGPAIGIIFDGTGYGTDGTLWGGEFLYGDLFHWERRGWLRPMPLPGGEQAIREPWRLAWALLSELEGPAIEAERDILAARVEEKRVETVARMLERSLNCPLASGVGRLLDGWGALLELGDVATHEAQLPVALESLAGAQAGARSITHESLLKAKLGTHYAYSIDARTPGALILESAP